MELFIPSGMKSKRENSNQMEWNGSLYYVVFDTTKSRIESNGLFDHNEKPCLLRTRNNKSIPIINEKSCFFLFC